MVSTDEPGGLKSVAARILTPPPSAAVTADIRERMKWSFRMETEQRRLLKERPRANMRLVVL